jgi:regulator of sigma E protease
LLVFLVFIHELGHFLSAKAFRLKVAEFGIGFPPRLLAVRFGSEGVVYSINALPLGGFVRMADETPHSSKPKRVLTVARTPKSVSNRSILFNDATAAKRAIVLLSGSLVNLAFPLLAFTFVFANLHATIAADTLVTRVKPGSPAARAGLGAGDIIVSLAGEEIESPAHLIRETPRHLGKRVSLSYIDGIFLTGSPDPVMLSAARTTVYLTPRLSPPPGEGAMGVTITAHNVRSQTRNYTGIEGFSMALSEMRQMALSARSSVSNWSSIRENADIMGPVGIAQVTDEVARFGFAPLVHFAALMSISLGILNLLPIPALDGGRLMFLLIEVARGGRKVSNRVENIAHAIGFTVILSLIVIISWVDALRLLNQ